MKLTGLLTGCLKPGNIDSLQQVCGDASRAVARTLIGGGGCIFIYSGSARLTPFEINFISKETSRAEPEYMNIHPSPPISALATALDARLHQTVVYLSVVFTWRIVNLN